MAAASSGELTEPLSFVFTDVVGSTKLWAADPEGTARSFVVHDAVVRGAIADHGGQMFGWAGDSFRACFSDRRAAVDACLAIQDRLGAHDWHDGPPLRVRIGVTRGTALHRDAEFFGPTLNTAARLGEIGWPGQTVLSSAAVAGIEGVAVAALGRHRVRDVAEELELFQLGEESFEPLRTIDATLSTLPPTTGKLVGRASTVSEVRAALGSRLPVTVVGTGGAGKTRLAVEVAHLELSDHPDGCYFIDLTSVADPSGVAPTIARSSRIRLAGGDPLAEIVDYFADRRALLVFDNCEHLVSTIQRYVQYLNMGAPGLGLLATSREPLGVPGERVVTVGPLPTVADGGPAVEFFVQRIHETAPEFDPSPAELSQIAQICDHLDGIPLALELAASRSGILGLDHLLSGMHDRFRLLSSKSGDGSRTLREAIDWSFGLLSEAEQDFFSRCGVFNGSFDLRAASAVAPDIDPLDTADLLHSLTRKSLIVPEGVLAGRFRLLETIRAYALLRLDDAGIEADVRELHFSHYCDLASVEQLESANDLDRAALLADDWSNIRGALTWGTENREWVRSAHLAAGCIGLWEDHVDVVEGKQWVDRIVPQLDPDDACASVLEFALAAFEAQLDNFERVHELLSGLVVSSYPEVRARSLALVGYIEAREHPDKSLVLFGQAESLVQEHNLGPDPRVTLLWTRGSHALYASDYEEAFRCFRQGFDEALEMSTRTVNTIYAGLSLAVVQILLDRPSAALATLDSYNWSDSRWDSSPIIRGVALIDLGRVNEAADLIFPFAEQSLRGRLPRMSNDALIGLAALALHRSEDEHAWTLFRQAMTPRTPFTIGLVEGLATRIGRGDELRTMHRTRTVALAELDAIDDLRAELGRLGAQVSER